MTTMSIYCIVYVIHFQITIPNDRDTHFDINDFTVRIMSVDQGSSGQQYVLLFSKVKCLKLNFLFHPQTFKIKKIRTAPPPPPNPPL